MKLKSKIGHNRKKMKKTNCGIYLNIDMVLLLAWIDFSNHGVNGA